MHKLLLIDPGSQDMACELIQKVELHNIGAGPGPAGGKTKQPCCTTIADGVARIELSGVLMRGTDWPGTTCLTAFAEAVRSSDQNPNVNCLLIACDSPGGTVSGTLEAAAAVAAAKKPVIGCVSGLCASAAYWVLCNCDQVYGTLSSNVGSIGAYMAFFDMSALFAQAGIKTEVISSGKYKGAGMIGTSLTPDQRAQLQAQVDAIAADFKAAVAENRKPMCIDPKCMEGQVMHAKEALANCLIDGIVPSEGDVLSMLR